MKSAIVTGATGFIGSFFVEHLFRCGIDVLALGRKDFSQLNEMRRERLKSVAYCQLDMAEISELPNCLNQIGWSVGPECVFFNLAWGGVSGLSDLDIEAQLENVHQSAAALNTANQIGCTRFIQVGTMEEAFTQQYLALDHSIHSQYNRHVIYSVAKMAARRALELKAAQVGMDFIYVLHSHVMGVDDDKDSFLQVTLQKLIRGEDLVFSSGEQYFDVVAVEDCVSGYTGVCRNGVPGKTYWVGSGEPKRLREYVERMYHLYPSGKDMEFGKLPYNDIVLQKEVFSIDDLVADTGYRPSLKYEDIVKRLHTHLCDIEARKNKEL